MTSETPGAVLLANGSPHTSNNKILAENSNLLMEEDGVGELSMDMDAQSLTGATNVSSLAFSKGGLNKRVSFGSGKGTVVETFVYESPSSGVDSAGNQRPLEPPSKVKVTATDSQLPSYIAPPTAVGNSDSSDSLKAIGSANRPLPSASGVVQFSPPLPSLKKMEEEKDNPFRPDGELNAEVDPIVEVYKKRPFPEGHETPDGSRPTSPNSPKIESEKEDKSPKKNSKWKWKEEDSDKKGKQNGTAVDGETPIKPSHIDLQLAASPGEERAEQNAPLIGEAHKTTLTSPKAGKVELVHLEEKKRKCGCCTVQ